MAAGSLVLCIMPAERNNDTYIGLFRAVGGFGIISYGLAASLLGVLLFRKPVALVIDRQGIIDRSDWTSVGRINWSEIRRVRTIWIGMRVLVIDAHNPRHFLGRGRVWQRMLRRLRIWPIVLSSITLDIGFNELRRTISRFCEEAARRTP
jgi:hypothetical protein